MEPSHAGPVGIDLGTTFSVLAYLDSTGRPRVVPSLDGGTTTPSIVHFSSAGVCVGREASKAARQDPAGLAQFAKRDMGKAAYRHPVRGQELPPEVIQAMVLQKLRQDATVTLGEFRKAVITVPAYFNEPRRKATMDAGRLAGLEVIDILNEPTAAAIAYGVQQGFLDAQGQARAAEKILVYDLGGGTFDVTVMQIDGRHYRALATDGDVYLGGIDWDQRLADRLAEAFQAAHGIDLRDDPAARQMLRDEAEDAKRNLSVRNRVLVRLNWESRRCEVPITAEELEDLTGDLVDRTLFTVRSVLREAKLKWTDLTRILLVGGSSRMPMVQKALARETEVPLDRSMLSEEPVAMGAALYAGLLLGQGDARPQIAVQNVCSHPLGVLGVEMKTGQPRRKVLIPRNAPLPAAGAGTFQTHRANQDHVLVRVVEGGDDSGRNATPVGVCVVSGLPPDLPAGTRVRVQFGYAANGRLKVRAALPGTSAEVTMALERPSGLAADTLAQWREWIEAGAILDEPEPAPQPAAEESSPVAEDAPVAEDVVQPVPPTGEPELDLPEDAPGAGGGGMDWSFVEDAPPRPAASRPAASKPRGKPAAKPARPAAEETSGLDDFLNGLG